MTTPEAKVRDPTVAWAAHQGILHKRLHFGAGENAWPDDIFIIQGGIHVWVEFKAAGKEPTPLQMHRIQKLQEQGAMVFWSDNAEQAINALSRLQSAAAVLNADVAVEESRHRGVKFDVSEFLRGKE